MRETTIGRNYAETLLELARRAGAIEAWGQLITAVADAVERDSTLRRFLESPRIDAANKNTVLAKALQDRAPQTFVRFLNVLVRNRRQMLLPAVASEYRALLDEELGRVRAHVTLPQPVSDADRDALASQLSRALGREVLPYIAVDPAILGGIVVRVGDTVMDGSVRRRLQQLRSRMLTGRAP